MNWMYFALPRREVYMMRISFLSSLVGKFFLLFFFLFFFVISAKVGRVDGWEVGQVGCVAAIAIAYGVFVVVVAAAIAFDDRDTVISFVGKNRVRVRRVRG